MQSTTRRGTIAAVSASIIVAVAASSATAAPAPVASIDKTGNGLATVGDRVVPTNAAITVDAATAYSVETAGVFGAATSASATATASTQAAVAAVRAEVPAARTQERQEVLDETAGEALPLVEAGDAEPQPEPVTQAVAEEPAVEVAQEAAPAAAAVEEQAAPAAEPAAVSAPASSGIGDQIVAIARQYVGTPYVFGGTTPAGFDCSGFTSYVFAQVGINISRSSSGQRGAGYVVSAADARPGDLVWWPGHVGIYTGGGNHIAARNPSSPLHESPIYRANPTYIRVAG